MSAPTRHRVGVTLLLALAATLMPLPAHASQGSVPAEVSAYAADPEGLIPRLETFVGVGADGKGIDFDETTEVGQLNRVFTFTPDWLAGVDTDIPVELQNEWTAPISIKGKPALLAIIWINPDTLKPELSDVVLDIDVAAALMDVPADATLVRDEPRDAWFTLVAPQLTPVVPGASGIGGPTTLTVYQGILAGREPAVSGPGDWFNLGSALSIATIAVAALLILLALIVPMLRRQRVERREAANEVDGP